MHKIVNIIVRIYYVMAREVFHWSRNKYGGVCIALAAISLIIFSSSSCSTVSLGPVNDLAVHGYIPTPPPKPTPTPDEGRLAKTPDYVSVLVPKKLDTKKPFTYHFRDLVGTGTESNGSILDLTSLQTAVGTETAGFIENCIESAKVVRIKEDVNCKIFDVVLVFKNPFNNIEGDTSENLNNWVSNCDCQALDDESNGDCFADKIAEFLKELPNIYQYKKNKTNSDASIKKVSFVGNIAQLIGKHDKEKEINWWEKISFSRKFAGIETIQPESVEEAVRDIGVIAVPHDVRFQRDRQLVAFKYYIGQRVYPGEFICLETAQHTVDRDGRNLFLSTQEPGPTACFTLGPILKPKENHISIAVDPLLNWLNNKDLEISPLYVFESKKELRGNNTSDNIITERDIIGRSGSVKGNNVLSRTYGNRKYEFAYLFRKYESRILAEGYARHIDIDKVEDQLVVNPLKGRSSFLIMTHDEDFLTSLRKQLFKQNVEKNKTKNKSGCDVRAMFVNATYNYNNNATEDICDEKLVTDEKDEEARKLFQDLEFTANSTPSIEFNVVIGGKPTIVRSGATLLSIIDSKYYISRDILTLRGTKDKVDKAEIDLIRKIVKNLSFSRIVHGERQKIDLNNAYRIEDLLIGLNPGDSIIWQN